MVLVHAFEYIGNPFEEVSGHVGELLTLDIKEKMNDDVEQKTGNIVKTGQQRRWPNIEPTLNKCTMFERTSSCSPANTRHLYNIYTTSAQRFRRWSNTA